MRERGLRKGGEGAFTIQEIKQEYHRPGAYTLYDARGRPVYDGYSRDIRRRLEDELYGRSDIRQIRGKAVIPKLTKSFRVNYMETEAAKARDRRVKTRCGLI